MRPVLGWAYNGQQINCNSPRFAKIVKEAGHPADLLSLTVECPTGSGYLMNLAEVATELSRQLVRLFRRNEQDRRPIYGG